MTNRSIQIVAVFGTGLALLVTALLRGQRVPRPSEESRQRSTLASTTVTIGPEMADSLASALVREAPFRWSRRVTVAAGIAVPGIANAAAVVPASAKPVLMLAGIVWGLHPLAVLEGVPGAAEPRVVAEGDSAGGLTVVSVGRDRVVVTGFDTLWTLKLKANWP